MHQHTPISYPPQHPTTISPTKINNKQLQLIYQTNNNQSDVSSSETDKNEIPTIKIHMLWIYLMLVVFIYYGCVVLNVYVQEKGRLLMMSIVSTQEDNDNVNYLVLLGRLAFIGIYILQNVVEIGITVALAVLIEKKSQFYQAHRVRLFRGWIGIIVLLKTVVILMQFYYSGRLFRPSFYTQVVYKANNSSALPIYSLTQSLISSVMLIGFAIFAYFLYTHEEKKREQFKIQNLKSAKNIQSTQFLKKQ